MPKFTAQARMAFRQCSAQDLETYLDEDAGFCCRCGEWTGGVEPDAENYECDACGAAAVIGIALLIGA